MSTSGGSPANASDAALSRWARAATAVESRSTDFTQHPDSIGAQGVPARPLRPSVGETAMETALLRRWDSGLLRMDIGDRWKMSTFTVCAGGLARKRIAPGIRALIPNGLSLPRTPCLPEAA